MYEVKKIFTFEMAHQLVSCYSEDCQNIHGHSYKLEVSVRGKELNQDGMLIDFKLLKERVNLLVDQWDHCFMANTEVKQQINIAGKVFLFAGNTTAENMAEYAYWFLKTLIPDIKRINLWETATGCASYWESE